jgi:hypothetical protein
VVHVTDARIASLRARIDEAERVVREAARQTGYFEIQGWAWYDADWGGYFLFDLHEAERTDVGMPAWVLRQIAAARAILDRYEKTAPPYADSRQQEIHETLRDEVIPGLAAAYEGRSSDDVG